MPIEGRRFGRLTAIKRDKRRTYCLCDCGTERWFTHSNLGKCTHSCGCLRREQVITRITKHGHAIGGNAKEFSREYVAWRKMRQRCLDPNDPRFPYYGGRGIKIDPRWDDFNVFLSDVGIKPTPEHSLDRYPDRDGDYTPTNVRWATKKEQSNNMRSNARIEIDGVVRTLTEWAECYGIKPCVIRGRLRLGWNGRDAVTTPIWKKPK